MEWRFKARLVGYIGLAVSFLCELCILFAAVATRVVTDPKFTEDYPDEDVNTKFILWGLWLFSGVLTGITLSALCTAIALLVTTEENSDSRNA